jgi:hypothetical protein
LQIGKNEIRFHLFNYSTPRTSRINNPMPTTIR